MIRSVSRTCLVALTLVALVAGCGTPTSPTITTTTTTTTTSTSTTTYTTATETYNGSLSSGGSNIYNFDATPGLITVTMVSMTPSTLLPAIGLGLGIWDGTNCTIVVQNVASQPGTVVTGTASIASHFCVRVWDVNGFGSGYVQNYQVTALHYKVAGT
jgi:hypothetical protein